MKRLSILVAVVAFTLGLIAAGSRARSDTAAVDRSDEITRLQKERHEVLSKVVDIVAEGYRNGQAGYDAVHQASNRLLDVELDMAGDHDSRIAVLEKQVQLMETWNKVAESRFQVGQDSQTAVLTARAAVLDAKIQLLKEQGK